jgi:hypothetical protein
LSQRINQAAHLHKEAKSVDGFLKRNFSFLNQLPVVREGVPTARAKRWGSGVIWKIILRDFWADIYAITDRPQGKQLS